MSTVIATSLLPDSTANDTLTIGGTGDTVVIPGNIITTNTLQDAGGNTIFASDGSGTITSTGLPGAMVLLSSQTVSSAVDSVEFTTAITGAFTDTYVVYIFRYIQIKMTSNAKSIGFQVSTDGGNTYATTRTATVFSAAHNEANSVARLDNQSAGYGKASGSTRQYLTKEIKSDADSSACGELIFYEPTQTRYTKNWYGTGQVGPTSADMADTFYTAGYFNTTSAINALIFFDPEGASTIASGTFKMYGIRKS